MKGRERELVRERWPEVDAWLEAAPLASVRRLDAPRADAGPLLQVDGIQLAGGVDARAEAELQASLVPTGAPRATVYGLGQGELVRVLLGRPGLESLRVVLFSAAEACASFEHLEHADWLADPRVELERADRASLKAPFAVVPPSLHLADDDAGALRDRVRMELDGPHVRRHRRSLEAGVCEQVARNRDIVAADGDVAELFGAHPGGRVRVAAAGPTLSDHYDLLREAEAPLIAVDAALRPLLAAGVVPDVVVTVDSHAVGLEEVFDLDLEPLRDSHLVYVPAVPRGVLERWPGPRLVAYDDHPRYEALRAEHSRARLWSSGSVIHSAVDLAVKSGAARVELFGADFATPRGRTHVAGAAWNKAVLASRGVPWVLDGHGRRVATKRNLVSYLRDLEAFIDQQPSVRFLRAGLDGAAIAGTACLEEVSHVA